MADDEPLVLSFVPALVVLLVDAERRKGEPLTRDEVEDLRDGATCIAVPRSAEAALAEQRGYDDLDPEHAWDEWQLTRHQLADADAEGTADDPPA